MSSLGGPPSLATLTDLELAGMPRGPALDDGLGKELSRRSFAAFGANSGQRAQDLSVTWGDLCQRNPCHREDFWSECRAFYAGGDRLLGDAKIMDRVFPRHAFEDPRVYADRRSRAHYFAYPGTIIDQMMSGLSGDPLRITFGSVDARGVVKQDASSEWWSEFCADVTDEGDSVDGSDAEGGRSLHQFLEDTIRECQQTRHAWILLDRYIDGDGHSSHPRLCMVPAEEVVDWECDELSKELSWVLRLQRFSPRGGLRDRRRMVRHVFTLWTAVDSVSYVIDVDPQSPPADGYEVKANEPVPHDFGRVPFEKVELPEGLYAMGKLHSLAKEHLNKRCAMAWAEFKSLHPIMYEFLAPDDMDGSVPIIGPAASASRATDQVRAQGRTQIRRKDDDARFIGPDPSPFQAARESCNDLMREMCRVMFSNNLAADVTKGSQDRSGDSKEADEEGTKVVLRAIGEIVRRIARVVIGMVAVSRGEEPPEYQMSGLEKFSTQGISDSIDEATALFAGVPIKSSTFNAVYLNAVYSQIAASRGATAEQLADIRDEVAMSSSAEELLAKSASTSTDEMGADESDDEDGTSAYGDEDRPMASSRPGFSARMRR